jgi:hypothetical protein
MRDPVRSPISKLQIGRLVVGWVTTSEYLLLYVLVFLFFLNFFFFRFFDELCVAGGLSGPFLPFFLPLLIGEKPKV